ncbi:MAG: sensor histidine kinase [Thermoguttaceae bacterium]
MTLKLHTPDPLELDGKADLQNTPDSLELDEKADSQNTPDPLELDEKADLQTVLSAWHTATVRLEQTHESLRAEVQELTRELEAKNRQLARKDRLADLGQMASHVAHEVRNNLVPVTLYLSLLRRRIAGDRGSLDVLDKITAGFTALDVMVNDLLHFTSDRDPHWQTFSLSALIDDVRDALAAQFAAQAIRTAVDVPKSLSVTADRDMIRRAVLNMVLNAMDAMPEGGTLDITACRTPGGVELEIADSGPGLSENVLPRIFEPFFTTKQTGTGLGLAIVARIAEVHGGEATAANCPQGGAAFTLRIPHLVREAAA